MDGFEGFVAQPIPMDSGFFHGGGECTHIINDKILFFIDLPSLGHLNFVLMITFGKTSGVAVAAMSCLAAHFGKASLSSSEIAAARRLTPAHVAKVMTQLSAAGLVRGVRGPSGGYRLARAPAEISLADIVGLFEQSRSNILCPFGADWCGKKDPCPLHDRMVALHESNRAALAAMTLDAFCHENAD